MVVVGRRVRPTAHGHKCSTPPCSAKRLGYLFHRVLSEVSECHSRHTLAALLSSLSLRYEKTWIVTCTNGTRGDEGKMSRVSCFALLRMWYLVWND